MTGLDAEATARKSISGHFRIWKVVYDSLEEEAAKRKVSLNTLVNQVLYGHTGEELLLEEMRFLRMSRGVYRALLGVVPDDKLSEMGRVSAKSEDTVMLAFSGNVNLHAVLDEMQRVSRFGWYSFHRTKTNEHETISLVHDLGPRYSVVLGAYATNMFAHAGIHPKIMTTDSSVVVTY
jgi:hypothetical protein